MDEALFPFSGRPLPQGLEVIGWVRITGELEAVKSLCKQHLLFTTKRLMLLGDEGLEFKVTLSRRPNSRGLVVADLEAVVYHKMNLVR